MANEDISNLVGYQKRIIIKHHDVITGIFQILKLFLPKRKKGDQFVLHELFRWTHCHSISWMMNFTFWAKIPPANMTSIPLTKQFFETSQIQCSCASNYISSQNSLRLIHSIINSLNKGNTADKAHFCLICCHKGFILFSYQYFLCYNQKLAQHSKCKARVPFSLLFLLSALWSCWCFLQTC